MGEAKRRGSLKDRMENPKGTNKNNYNPRMGWKLATNPDFPGIERSLDGKTFYERISRGTLKKITLKEILNRFPLEQKT